MIITRKTKIPLHWAFYAQLPLLMSIYGEFVINAPFLLLIKRFIDNPAAIMGLISLEIYISILGSPFISWLSDRVWTRWGRRKFFFTIADIGRGLCVLLMPFAPNLILLIALRWLFDAFSNFGSMTQALVYEVVPTPQRGRLAGFFQSSIQFGNLVFYFLLLGRFDDMYFMGPFDFATSVSGGAAMFWIAAIVLFAIAAYESLGFKEIKPPNRKTLQDDRKPGQSVFGYFITSFFRDVCSKDLLPLYLLAFVDVMVRINLGLFQPLQFTEQWGYSLQQFGNTVAIGVIFSVTFALFSGWFADRYGKMVTFVIASIGSLLVNLAFVIFLAIKPGHRPTLTEIVVFSNIEQIFSMVKAVIIFPLIMEYINRNRLGAANAGLQVMRTIFRSGMAVFVGVWILWWSLAFMPQAGYRVLTTYPEAITKAELAEELARSGLGSDEIMILPGEQGHKEGDPSQIWYLHKYDEQVQDLVEERKELTNKIAALETKLGSPMSDESHRTKMRAEVEADKLRLLETDSALSDGAAALNKQIASHTENKRTASGDQFLSATYSNNQLTLSLTAVGTADSELENRFPNDLDGPPIAQHLDEDSRLLRPEIEADFQEESVNISATFRPSFVFLYRVANRVLSDPNAAYELATVLQSIHDAELGRDEGLINFQASQEETDEKALSYELMLNQELDPQAIESLAATLQAERLIESAHYRELSPSRYRFALTTPSTERKDTATENASRIEEAENRLLQLLPRTGESIPSMVAAFYLRVTATLSSVPYNVIVPEHTTQALHKERVYEYFFSSRTLMILTDFIGFAIIALLVRLERKGKIHKYGVEEDENR
ncbi:MFS transporter [Pelagicoccus albus]|uniref:MFS transporter n=1 Tax=Pelagicoccus albus TaxID=415222 RepID=A0A7X1B9Z5_9BACT|nr:MFS transporter [Pelagicoccus albus]MBC2607065.1 MFS transporter [Pelagicoccus albus]